MTFRGSSETNFAIPGTIRFYVSVFYGELVTMFAVTSLWWWKMAAFCNGIFDVIAGSTNKEMARIYASWIVALMTNIGFSRITVKVQSEEKMRYHPSDYSLFSLVVNYSVPFNIVTIPFPTSCLVIP